MNLNVINPLPPSQHEHWRWFVGKKERGRGFRVFGHKTKRRDMGFDCWKDAVRLAVLRAAEQRIDHKLYGIKCK